MSPCAKTSTPKRHLLSNGRPLCFALAVLNTAHFASAPAEAGDACCAQQKEAAFAALTGDWGGVRSSLKERGIQFLGDYTSELFGNPAGGRQRGAVVDGLARLFLDVDLEKTLGWNGAAFRVSGLYAHGTSGSLRYVGDAAFFSSIDAYDGVRLLDFWVEQHLFDEKAALRIGQMPFDTEFGVSDVAGLFINASYGVPSPPVTPMPFGAYPVTALGIQIKVEPAKGFYGKAGVYDGNPSPGDFPDPSDGVTQPAKRYGTDWALRPSEGALWAGELGYQRSEGAFPGTYRIGALYHSDDFADVRSDFAGTIRRGSTSGYYVIDQTLWKKAGDAEESVSAFVRGTVAEKKTSLMSNSLQFGAVYTGLVSTADKLGVSFARSDFSPGQLFNVDGRAYQPDHETVAELTYQIPLKPYLRVQPDLQYIRHPGGTTAYQNAWVLGIRATVDF
jgi:porin